MGSVPIFSDITIAIVIAFTLGNSTKEMLLTQFSNVAFAIAVETA